jgi:hypothetical protein
VNTDPEVHIEFGITVCKGKIRPERPEQTANLAPTSVTTKSLIRLCDQAASQRIEDVDCRPDRVDDSDVSVEHGRDAGHDLDVGNVDGVDVSTAFVENLKEATFHLATTPISSLKCQLSWTKAQCYKTFFVRDLLFFIIS